MLDILNRRTRLLTGCAALALTVAPGVAHAQAAPDAAPQATPDAATPDAAAPDAPDGAAPGDIVVTGSRIPQAGFDTPQPAVVISSKQIEQRGYTNIADALSELPAFGVPGNNRVGGQTGDLGAGQTFVDFFGLGSQRTLTLVNGRRFVSSNTASIFGPVSAGTQVDFNTIPTKLVDRVETIAVGGAPIYGSDAIAGTINVILKRDYSGIDLDAQYGLTGEGDAPEYRFRALAGWNFAGGKGNITVSGEYDHADGLLATDRAVTNNGFFFTTPADPDSPFANVLIANRRVPSVTDTGVPLVTDFIPLSPAQVAAFGINPNVTNGAGTALQFGADGHLTPYNFGQDTGSVINFAGGDGFDLNPVSNLLSPVRRILATALAQYQATDHIRIFGEGWYANSRGTELRQQPVYNAAIFAAAGTPGGALIVPLSNPFLSAADRATIQNSINNNDSDQNFGAGPQDYFYLNRADTDLKSGLASAEVELYRFIAGVDGDVQVGPHEWHFELIGNYGRSRTSGHTLEVNLQNFQNALDAVVGPGGTITCRPGYTNSPIATLSATCAPLNPFGQQASQAAKDYITTITDPRSVNDQYDFVASVAGDLIDLPAGGLGFAIGYEHRDEGSTFDPGAFYYGAPNPADPENRQSYGFGAPIDPVSGRFNTDEFFGELKLPLISPEMHVPAIHRLALNGAVRHVDQSRTGGDWTYTGGAEWAPIADVTFRGNYTRSIRNPAVTELFNPNSQIFTFANDPCDSRFRGRGPNPATRQANCTTAGLPANFVSNIVDATALGSLNGNPDLLNEKADSYTFGAVLRPRFIPGLTVAVDWVNIKLKDAITALSATQVLEACFDSADYPNSYCGQVTRDATGQVTFVKTGFANAAIEQYKGLIAEASYHTGTPFLGASSAIDINVSYQYLDTLFQRVGLGDLTTIAGSPGYSKHKATGALTYSNKGFSWQIQAQYIGPATIDPDAPANSYDFPTLNDVVFFNSAMSIDVAKRLTLRFIVENVLDQKPPFNAVAAGGLVPYFSGVLGRNFRVGAAVHF